MKLVGKPSSQALSEPLGQAQFKVYGDASSQLLMRILGLLAQQSLLPQDATMHHRDGVLEVRMKVVFHSRHRAEVIAEKMRAMVETHQVHFSWRALRRDAPDFVDRLRFASGLRANRAAIASILRRCSKWCQTLGFVARSGSQGSMDNA